MAKKRLNMQKKRPRMQGNPSLPKTHTEVLLTDKYVIESIRETLKLYSTNTLFDEGFDIEMALQMLNLLENYPKYAFPRDVLRELFGMSDLELGAALVVMGFDRNEEGIGVL